MILVIVCRLEAGPTNQWKLAAGDQDQAVGYVFLQQSLETRAQQGPVESIMPL